MQVIWPLPFVDKLCVRGVILSTRLPKTQSYPAHEWLTVKTFDTCGSENSENVQEFGSIMRCHAERIPWGGDRRNWSLFNGERTFPNENDLLQYQTQTGAGTCNDEMGEVCYDIGVTYCSLI